MSAHDSIPQAPPDDFAADMAAIARLGRQLWSRALWGERKPEADAYIWESLNADYNDQGLIPPTLALSLDLAMFDCIAEDIARIAVAS